MQQVVVIHGGETFTTYEEYLTYLKAIELDFARASTKGWKDTLEETLGEAFDVVRPRMPNGLNAKYLEWHIWFSKYLPHLKEGVILIGHSLGGIFLAKYLAENTLPVKVKALYLIAAPYNTADASYALADFVLPSSLLHITEQVARIVLIHSKDDMIVPFADLSKYKNALPEAETMVFEDRGHFIDETFPELVNEITSCAKSEEVG